MYRVGFPGWKLAAKLGVPVRLRVYIKQDLAANVYVAQSPDLQGLVIEGHTLEEVKNEALVCSKYLLEQIANCYSRHTANAIMKQAQLAYRFK